MGSRLRGNDEWCVARGFAPRIEYGAGSDAGTTGFQERRNGNPVFTGQALRGNDGWCVYERFGAVR